MKNSNSKVHTPYAVRHTYHVHFPPLGGTTPLIWNPELAVNTQNGNSYLKIISWFLWIWNISILNKLNRQEKLKNQENSSTVGIKKVHIEERKEGTHTSEDPYPYVSRNVTRVEHYFAEHAVHGICWPELVQIRNEITKKNNVPSSRFWKSHPPILTFLKYSNMACGMGGANVKTQLHCDLSCCTLPTCCMYF